MLAVLLPPPWALISFPSSHRRCQSFRLSSHPPSLLAPCRPPAEGPEMLRPPLTTRRRAPRWSRPPSPSPTTGGPRIAAPTELEAPRRPPPPPDVTARGPMSARLTPGLVRDSTWTGLPSVGARALQARESSPGILAASRPLIGRHNSRRVLIGQAQSHSQFNQ
jgi:hypothetical protein